MKVHRLVQFAAVIIVSSSFVFGQEIVELKYPTHSITTIAQPHSDAEIKAAAFITARTGTAGGKEFHPFGIMLREQGESAGRQTVLEIFDAAKNVSIKKVSLSEYFGKQSAGWQMLEAEAKSTPERIVSVFRVQSGSYNFKLIREIAIVEDRNLPLGKKMNLSFSIESSNPLTSRIKFFGTAAGLWENTRNTFVIAESDTLLRVQPAMVFHPLFDSTIEVERSQKKSDPVRFTVTSKEVLLSQTVPTVVFALEVATTTISFEEYIAQQVKNLQSYFNTHVSKPEMVTVTQASKASTRPGDTLMFLVYSHNIGTAASADNSLNNIIPAGTSYIEGTAEGKGSTISYTKIESTPPQVNRVTNITWKFQEPIYPGEERIASFKVKIQ